MRTTRTRVSTGDLEDSSTRLDDVRGDTASVLSERLDNESVSDPSDAEVEVNDEQDYVSQSPSDGQPDESQELYGSDSQLAGAGEYTDSFLSLEGENRLNRRGGFTGNIELNLLRFLISEVPSISAESTRKKVDFYETCKEKIRTCDDDDKLLACIPKSIVKKQRLQTYISNLVKAEVKREKEKANHTGDGVADSTLMQCRAEFYNGWVSAWEELKDSKRKRSDEENSFREVRRRHFTILTSTPSSVSVTSNNTPSPRSRAQTRVSSSDVTNDMRTMVSTFSDAARVFIANMNQRKERNLASQDRESDMKQNMDKLRREFQTLQENTKADLKRLEEKIDKNSRRMENKMDDYSLLLVQKVKETLALSKSAN